MRRTITIPTAFLLAALALTGCSAGSSGSAESGVARAPAVVPDAASGSKLDSTAGDASTATDSNREVITTGYATISVDEPLAAADEAVKITEQAGGRVDGRDEYAPKDDTDKGSATLTLRIPSAALTATLDKLRGLGKVQEVSITSNDVTMTTQDLDARITALSASVDRLVALLGTATDTDNLIAIETALSDRQAQLESLESERRYYADQVSLSTVTLNLVSTADTPADQPSTFFSGLAAGWTALVAFLAGLLVVLGVLLPWLVLLGVIAVVVVLIVRRARRARRAAPSPSE